MAPNDFFDANNRVKSANARLNAILSRARTNQDIAEPANQDLLDWMNNDDEQARIRNYSSVTNTLKNDLPASEGWQFVEEGGRTRVYFTGPTGQHMLGTLEEGPQGGIMMNGNQIVPAIQKQGPAQFSRETPREMIGRALKQDRNAVLEGRRPSATHGLTQQFRNVDSTFNRQNPALSRMPIQTQQEIYHSYLLRSGEGRNAQYDPHQFGLPGGLVTDDAYSGGSFLAYPLQKTARAGVGGIADAAGNLYHSLGSKLFKGRKNWNRRTAAGEMSNPLGTLYSQSASVPLVGETRRNYRSFETPQYMPERGHRANIAVLPDTGLWGDATLAGGRFEGGKFSRTQNKFIKLDQNSLTRVRAAQALQRAGVTSLDQLATDQQAYERLFQENPGLTHADFSSPLHLNTSDEWQSSRKNFALGDRINLPGGRQPGWRRRVTSYDVDAERGGVNVRYDEEANLGDINWSFKTGGFKGLVQMVQNLNRKVYSLDRRSEGIDMVVPGMRDPGAWATNTLRALHPDEMRALSTRYAKTHSKAAKALEHYAGGGVIGRQPLRDVGRMKAIGKLFSEHYATTFNVRHKVNALQLQDMMKAGMMPQRVSAGGGKWMTPGADIAAYNQFLQGADPNAAFNTQWTMAGWLAPGMVQGREEYQGQSYVNMEELSALRARGETAMLDRIMQSGASHQSPYAAMFGAIMSNQEQSPMGSLAGQNLITPGELSASGNALLASTMERGASLGVDANDPRVFQRLFMENLAEDPQFAGRGFAVPGEGGTMHMPSPENILALGGKTPVGYEMANPLMGNMSRLLGMAAFGEGSPLHLDQETGEPIDVAALSERVSSGMAGFFNSKGASRGLMGMFPKFGGNFTMSGSTELAANEIQADYKDIARIMGVSVSEAKELVKSGAPMQAMLFRRPNQQDEMRGVWATLKHGKGRTQISTYLSALLRGDTDADFYLALGGNYKDSEGNWVNTAGKVMSPEEVREAAIKSTAGEWESIQSKRKGFAGTLQSRLGQIGGLNEQIRAAKAAGDTQQMEFLRKKRGGVTRKLFDQMINGRRNMSAAEAKNAKAMRALGISKSMFANRSTPRDIERMGQQNAVAKSMMGKAYNELDRRQTTLMDMMGINDASNPRRQLAKDFAADVYQKPLDLELMGTSESRLMDIMRTSNAAKFGGVLLGTGENLLRGEMGGQSYGNLTGMENALFSAGLGMVREADEGDARTTRARQVGAMFAPRDEDIDTFAGIFSGTGDESAIFKQLNKAYRDVDPSLGTAYDRFYAGGDQRSIMHRNAGGQFALRGARKMNTDPVFGGREATLDEIFANQNVLKQRNPEMTDAMWESAREAHTINQIKTAQGKSPTLDAIQTLLTQGAGPIVDMLRGGLNMSPAQKAALTTRQQAAFDATRPSPGQRALLKGGPGGTSVPIPPSAGGAGGSSGGGPPIAEGGGYIDDDSFGGFHTSNERSLGGGGGMPWVPSDLATRDDVAYAQKQAMKMGLERKNPMTVLRDLERNADIFNKVITKTGDQLGLSAKKGEPLIQTLTELNKRLEEGGKLTKQEAQTITSLHKMAKAGDVTTTLGQMREVGGGAKQTEMYAAVARKYGGDYADQVTALLGEGGDLGPLEQAARSAKAAQGTKDFASSGGGRRGAGGGFLSDVNQMLGMNLFFANRAWNFTGGKVMGMMDEYLQGNAQMREVGMGAGMGAGDFNGAIMEQMRTQQRWGSFRKGVGEAAYNIWSPMMQGLAPQQTGPTALQKGLAIGGPALGAGLGAGFMAAPFAGPAAIPIGLGVAGLTALAGGLSAANQPQIREYNADYQASIDAGRWTAGASPDLVMSADQRERTRSQIDARGGSGADFAKASRGATWDYRWQRYNAYGDANQYTGNFGKDLMRDWKMTSALWKPVEELQAEEARQQAEKDDGYLQTLSGYGDIVAGKAGLSALPHKYWPEALSGLARTATKADPNLEPYGKEAVAGALGGLMRYGATMPSGEQLYRASAAESAGVDYTGFVRGVNQSLGYSGANAAAMNAGFGVFTGQLDNRAYQEDFGLNLQAGAGDMLKMMTHAGSFAGMSPADRQKSAGMMADSFGAMSPEQIDAVLNFQSNKNAYQQNSASLAQFGGLDSINAMMNAPNGMVGAQLGQIAGFQQSVAQRAYGLGAMPTQGMYNNINALSSVINPQNADFMIPQLQGLMNGDRRTISEMSRLGSIPSTFNGASLQTVQTGGQGTTGMQMFSDSMTAKWADTFAIRAAETLGVRLPDTLMKAMTQGQGADGLWHGGQQGIQEYQFQLQTQFQQQQRQWQAQDWALQQAVSRGVGMDQQLGFLPEELRISDREIAQQQFAIRKEQTLAQTEWKKEDRGIDFDQFMEKWEFGWNKMMTQFKWSMEDMQTSRSHQLTQRGWAEQDASFQRSSSQLEFGWQMEDYDRAIRFSRGRERMDLMRQQERSVIRFGMQQSQMDTGDQRRKEIAKWEDEEYQKEKGRLEQRQQWAMAEMEMDRRFFEERFNRESMRFEQQVAWEMQLLALDETKFNRDQQIADYEANLQEQRMAATNAYAEQMNAISALEMMIGQEMAVREAATMEFSRALITDTQLLLEVAGALAGKAQEVMDILNEADSSSYDPYDPYDDTDAGAAGPTGPPKPNWGGGYIQRSFARGGYTGNMGKYAPVGIVHGGEYVVPQEGVPIVRGDDGKVVEVSERMLQVLIRIAEELSDGKTNITVNSVDPRGVATDKGFADSVRGKM